jgi:hypothetical protein
MRRTARWCAVVAAAALALSPTTTALAGTTAHKAGSAKAHTKPVKLSKKAAARAARNDIRGIGIGAHGTKKLRIGKATKAQLRTFTRLAQRRASLAAVGDIVVWPALNDVTNRIRLQPFKLMGDGTKIQIWVAVDGTTGAQALAFPAGDCRNTIGGGAAITVTQAQVDGFVSEFDNNMFPKESVAFSVAPDRDGTLRPLPDLLGTDGPGDKIVTLVDNVRDANYFTPTAPDGQTYIAGFFSSQFNDLADRNVMTIDSFDWLHRTGATPPDDSADPAYVACTAELGQTRPLGQARPRLYEGTFAHEYQHLLESYVDPDEVNFVNEGLSDWAQSLVGYVNTNQRGAAPTADSHISCFQGFLGANFGGPENSLTQWEDQGAPEILCDYGAAYSFMEYLHGHFGGDAFMSALHTEPGNGLVGLQNVLTQFGVTVPAQEVVHRWQAMMALDFQLDQGARLEGGRKADYTTPTLKSEINFASPQAFSTAGAPPNGADYVQLRGRNGTLTAKDLDSLTFSGVGSYDPFPVEWTTTTDGRLYSGSGDLFDRAITRTVTVPQTGDQTLAADLEWNTELGWDFAFVQVFNPATGAWESLSNADTTSDHDPGAAANIVANLPGFTGPNAAPDADANGVFPPSSGVKHEVFDLSRFAGQTIEIGFRYMTDPAATGQGFFVDNVTVGGQLVSDGTDLAAWKSLTQAHPIKVAGWTLQLVAYGDGKKAYVARIPARYDAQTDTWTARVTKHVNHLIGNSRKTTTVAALVTADDPTESAPAYPRYQLRANNVLQPGGS